MFSNVCFLIKFSQPIEILKTFSEHGPDDFFDILFFYAQLNSFQFEQNRCKPVGYFFRVIIFHICMGPSRRSLLSADH